MNIKLLLLGLSSIICVQALAQLDTSDFSYDYKAIADINSTEGLDTLYFHKVNLELEDTSSVSKIEVKIGTSLSTANITNYQFNFDELTFLPKGYSYHRKKNSVELLLGRHPAGSYYIEVRLVDQYNNLTQAKSESIIQ